MSTSGDFVVHEQSRAGAELRCLAFGESGDWVVLVHGLCGHALEWRETAVCLVDKGYRVLVPEQRGHGQSERRPSDVSRSAFVADIALWLTTVCFEPVNLVGQSLGAHTAFLLARRQSHLVRSLVVVEATPKTDDTALPRLTRWLEQWPVPFATREAALAFFGGDTAYGRAWTDGLEHRADGLWPRFDTDIMHGALADCRRQGHWDEWTAVRCPTLVVRGERGMDIDVARRMCDLVPSASLVSIPDAGHDAHLEQPQAWCKCLASFLETTGSQRR